MPSLSRTLIRMPAAISFLCLRMIQFACLTCLHVPTRLRLHRARPMAYARYSSRGTNSPSSGRLNGVSHRSRLTRRMSSSLEQRPA